MLQKTVNLFVSIHLIASCFFLPAAIIFLVTGALYTVDIKGSYETETYPLPLDAPLEPDLDACRAMTEAFLEAEGIAPPSGGDRIRRFGTSFAYEWHGSNRDVLLSPTDDPSEAVIEVKDTTFYRRMVQLHKAKGGAIFKGYAVVFSVALVLILVTGYIVAWTRQPLRMQTVLSTVLGLIVFILVVLLS